MKTIKIRFVLGLLALFSLLFGASLKLWDYPYHDLFLVVGILCAIAIIISLIPKGNSFLDNWN